VSAIAGAWRRIEAWIKTNAPNTRLGPPASREALDELAKTIGRRVPDSLAESLRIHDGASFEIDLPYGDWKLSSASTSAEDWTSLVEIHAELDVTYGVENRRHRATGPVSPVPWRAEWIPFASNGAGDRLCVDMAPAPGGHLEQVIVYMRDAAPHEVLSPSIGDVLERFADGLESGAYMVDPLFGVVPRET
jgi:cell wall assembly regulator SMI1